MSLVHWLCGGKYRAEFCFWFSSWVQKTLWKIATVGPQPEEAHNQIMGTCYYSLIITVCCLIMHKMSVFFFLIDNLASIFEEQSLCSPFLKVPLTSLNMVDWIPVWLNLICNKKQINRFFLSQCRYSPSMWIRSLSKLWVDSHKLLEFNFLSRRQYRLVWFLINFNLPKVATASSVSFFRAIDLKT